MDLFSEFAKRTETKLPEGVGSVRSLSKQNSDQSNKDSAIYIGMFIIVTKFILKQS